MTLEYDKTADALEILLADGIVARTVELDPGTLVDVDEHGDPLSIEIIHPMRRWPLEEILDRFEVEEHDAEILSALWNERSRYPFAEPLVAA